MKTIVNKKPKARVIAFYLPQFHPTKENDRFWGKGFTEWTNVAKAKPLFKGHDQPRIPADLGFYDLRLEEIAEQQAELAREAGIEGFCYWHYWFGNGVETLEMPLDRMVKNKNPDYPFCIGWANHDWTTKTWTKGKNSQLQNSMIFEQKYLGKEDEEKHFYRLLDAFKDRRYMKVDGKNIFLIFDVHSFPNFIDFKNHWNNLARENGIPEFHFVGLTHSLNSAASVKQYDVMHDKIEQRLGYGYDALYLINQKYAEIKAGGIVKKLLYAANRRFLNGMLVERYSYRKVIDNYYTSEDKRENIYPQLLAGWDRSPRSGKKAIIYTNSNPKDFKYAAQRAIDCVKEKKEEHRIIFLNSWNEWGEGAYMEPDMRYGKGFIEALHEALYE